MKKAVVLLSGGLDSAVMLFYAIKKGYTCHCLGFDYGQRHKKEVSAARKLSRRAHAPFTCVKLAFPWKGSSLTDRKRALPRKRTLTEISRGIPSTYVPARNTIFLSYAASCAEALGASAVFIGAHAQDSSGYPDCGRQYLEAFDKTLAFGTKAGAMKRLRVKFPLIDKSKKEIIRLGETLGVPFQLTWSCYAGGTAPCGECDSCILREKGFREAGIVDPRRV